MVALLLDRFHLSLDDFAKLTDRQIQELYFHKRDKEDKIVVPEVVQGLQAPDGPSTLDGELHQLEALRSVLNWDEATHQQLQAELRAKFKERECPPSPNL